MKKLEIIAILWTMLLILVAFPTKAQVTIKTFTINSSEINISELENTEVKTTKGSRIFVETVVSISDKSEKAGKILVQVFAPELIENKLVAKKGNKQITLNGEPVKVKYVIHIPDNVKAITTPVL